MDEDPQKLADELEHEADRLEQHAEEIHRQVKDARERLIEQDQDQTTGTADAEPGQNADA